MPRRSWGVEKGRPKKIADSSNAEPKAKAKPKRRPIEARKAKKAPVRRPGARAMRDGAYEPA